jgi:hypothetical protein
MPNGSKLWRWKYRPAGKENRFATGANPEVPLKDACDRRDEARDQVKLGIHPSHKKRLDRITQGLERITPSRRSRRNGWG